MSGKSRSLARVIGYFSQTSKAEPTFSRLLSVSLICLAFSTFFPAHVEAGVDLSMGLSAIEEGDERMRPAATLTADFGKDWSLLLQNYGRIQKPVTQTTYLMAVTRQYPVFGSKSFRARVGGALAYEQSAMERTTGESERSANTNLGLYLGLNWQSDSRLFVSLDWGTGIFPAGMALLFLTTARKQSFSAGLGWRL